MRNDHGTGYPPEILVNYPETRQFIPDADYTPVFFFSCRMEIAYLFDTVRWENEIQKKRKKNKINNLEPGFPVFREAVTAVNRAAFGRLEWYFAFFPTV